MVMHLSYLTSSYIVVSRMKLPKSISTHTQMARADVIVSQPSVDRGRDADDH